MMRVRPVSLLITETVALGIAAELSSLTDPATLPVGAWANPPTVHATQRAAKARSHDERADFLSIRSPFFTPETL